MLFLDNFVNWLSKICCFFLAVKDLQDNSKRTLQPGSWREGSPSHFPAQILTKSHCLTAQIPAHSPSGSLNLFPCSIVLSKELKPYAWDSLFPAKKLSSQLPFYPFRTPSTPSELPLPLQNPLYPFKTPSTPSKPPLQRLSSFTSARGPTCRRLDASCIFYWLDSTLLPTYNKPFGFIIWTTPATK